ncbi:putative fad binding domain containing protein [Diaporthe ampelina]|uniref:Putative fad binding domain containing protein n=1 Tax=Diaporthe ampelina TaxID=1214573 RepID=A0A0G2FFP9_9PEZI|nr:putative fad binding domain containing protein [Diaporthe ampelina]
MEAQPFRVIVVGGGPVGLTAAHALLSAGIDFVVLEARPTFILEEGASLLAYASTQRVWHQLGLHGAMAAKACPVETRSSADHAGNVYRRGIPSATHQRLFGAQPWNFHRRELVEVLYEKLPAEVREEKLCAGRKVCGVEVDEEGVTVRCEDGRVERGSMVLGVDGVHSKTRGLMRELMLASKAKEGDSDDDEGCLPPERPYKAEYRCLWGTCPSPEACAPSSNAESHGPERSIMLMTGRDGRAWFFLYEQLDGARDESHKYTAEDQEGMAARFSQIHLLPGLPFGDIWPTRTACGMADQLEGVLPQRCWHLPAAQGGRVVLAGDAVHRMTPNFGWGFNSGVNDVCALVSLLRAEVVSSSSPSPSASTAQLDGIFARYAEARCVDDDVADVVSISGKVTRQCAHPRDRGIIAAAVAWLLTRVVPLLVPDFEAKIARKLLGRVMRRGRVLEFSKEDEDGSARRDDEKLFVGEVGWDFPMPTADVVMGDREDEKTEKREKEEVALLLSETEVGP